MEGFSVQGQWWLPEFPADKVVGTLTFDPDSGATLALIGSLPNTAPSPVPGIYLGTGGEYPRIVGVAENTSFTLEDCFRTGLSNMLAGRAAAETVYVNMVFRGVQYEAGEPLEASGITKKLSGLVEWMAPPRPAMRWIHPDRKVVPRRMGSVSIEVEQQLPARFTPAPHLRGRVDHKYGTRDDGGSERTLYQDQELVITTPGLLPVDALFDLAGLFQHLVSIGLDHPVRAEEIAFLHPDLERESPDRRMPTPIQFFACS